MAATLEQLGRPLGGASLRPTEAGRHSLRSHPRFGQLVLAVVGEGGGLIGDPTHPGAGGRVVKVASVLSIVSGVASVATTRKW